MTGSRDDLARALRRGDIRFLSDDDLATLARITSAEWAAFIAGVKAGEFDSIG